MNVTTVKSKREYRATVNDVRVTFVLGESSHGPTVWLFTPTSRLGGYLLDKWFGGELSPASVRKFITDNVKDS